MPSGWFTSSPVLQRWPGSGLTVPSHFAPLVADQEHFALLELPNRGARLRRKADLLDNGVAAVFHLADADAELVGLCFCNAQFTPAEAATWLAERGFAPLYFLVKP